MYDQLKQQQKVAQYQSQPESVPVVSTPVSSLMSIDNQNMFLYKDLSLSFQRKFTVTGICSVVFGLLSIGFEGGQLANGNAFTTWMTFISGPFSFYVGILLLVLCRQQIYALKSLLALIIIQLLIVLAILILNCLIIATSHSFQCKPNDFFSEERLKKCEKARVLAILMMIGNLVLLISIIFNLVLAIREWRATRRVVHDISSSSNSYLLTNIPLSLGENFKKTGIAYIVLGLLIVGLDVGLLLYGYPITFFTGFISGFFSVIYGVVLIVLSSKRIYVLTSLFSLALWQLIVLLATFVMICIGFKNYPCSTQMFPYDGKCKTAKGMAIVSLIAVGLSIAMTMVNMVSIVRGRQREQQHADLPPMRIVSSYINPINGKN